MSISSTERKKVETYAQTLLEVAKAEDREIVEVSDLEDLLSMYPETMGMLQVMNERNELDLVPQVLKAYQAMSKQGDSKPATPDITSNTHSAKSQDAKKVSTYARTLLEVAKVEGREGKEVEGLERILGLTPEVISMLAVMGDRNDTALLSRTVDAYKELVDKEGDTVAVEVTTAIPLDDELRASVKAKLEADFSKGVFLIEHVDPEIIGGIVLSARGNRRDASVRAQLANARQVLTQTQVGGDN